MQALMSIRFIVVTVLATALYATGSAAEAQIVDRPPAQARTPMSWGVAVGFAPNWTTPQTWGRLFLEEADPDRELTLEGNDFRIGIVRGRPLGFEFGINYVRKTIKDTMVVPAENFACCFPNEVPATVTYTATEGVQISGVDSHFLIPAARIGRRVLIGVLAGGGIGSVPNTLVRKTVEGPSFFTTCEPFGITGTPLPNPPPTGGCVRDNYGQTVPLVPGQRYGVVDEPFADSVSPTDDIWLFWRVMVSADVQVAPPLKVRFSGGFNFPSAQYFGVDLVYLFSARQ
jgi:hypothetical protein